LIYQAVYVVRWYLVVQVFGLAALPLCLRLFRRLPDRGYGVSKPFGLLLAGWAFWLLTTLGWLRNTAGGILVALALVALAGVALRLTNRQTNPTDRAAGGLWQTVFLTEAIFALAFVAWCIVRAYMPRIEPSGGEKWMESAFLRAILRSDTFPPHDPWLSGFAISYYYFGYVIVAMIARLADVPPSISFNIAIAMLFALVCTGAFSLVYNLIAAGRRDRELSATGGVEKTAVLGGLLGVLLVAVMGNLEGLLEVLHARGIGSAGFWQWLDVRALAENLPATFADGRWVPHRFIWWWQASRVVRDYTPLGVHQEVIDEFPGFSFLLGDMHPHVLGLPFVLLALALALNLYLRVSNHRLRTASRATLFWPFDGWEFVVYAVCLGGLGFLNTWDFPIYLFITMAAYALGRLPSIGLFRDTLPVELVDRLWLSLSSRRLSETTRQTLGSLVFVASVLLVAVTLLALSFVLYQPFWRSFQSQAGGVLPNLFNGTRVSQFLVMFGPLLLPAVAFVAGEARRHDVRVGRVVESTLSVLMGVVSTIAIVAVVAVFLLWSGVIQLQGPASYVNAWLRGKSLPELGGVPQPGMLVRQRVLVDPELLGPSPAIPKWDVVARAVLVSPVWTVVSLLALLIAMVLTLKSALSKAPEMPDGSRPEAGVREFILLLLATATLLVLSVEFIYLKDHFGTRMNTIFKFYFQAWVLLSIGGAYALAYLIRRVGFGASAMLLAVVVALCLVLVVTDGAVTPILLADVDLPLLIYVYVAGFCLALALLAVACGCVVLALARRGGVVAAGALFVATMLVIAGLLYPVLAIPERADEYGGPPTLDGDEYLARSNSADYSAIKWLNETIDDAPVILEHPGGGYQYEARVSAHTGLPTVLGWSGHEWQWRGSLDEQDRRSPDIEDIYNSADAGQVLTLLDKYGISYVFVGPVERQGYSPGGLAKFVEIMDVVYDQDGVIIYKR
jgi:YYY domain-containing protein